MVLSIPSLSSLSHYLTIKADYMYIVAPLWNSLSCYISGCVRSSRSNNVCQFSVKNTHFSSFWHWSLRHSFNTLWVLSQALTSSDRWSLKQFVLLYFLVFRAPHWHLVWWSCTPRCDWQYWAADTKPSGQSPPPRPPGQSPWPCCTRRRCSQGCPPPAQCWGQDKDLRVCSSQERAPGEKREDWLAERKQLQKFKCLSVRLLRNYGVQITSHK